MNYNMNPVATLKNRKMELQIRDLPASLGRNNEVVNIYLFHESVSREHCLFECINRKFTVMDLGSTFGTSVNGVKLEPNVRYHIEDGAKIQFGKVKMVFNADYQALAEWERMQNQPAPAASQSREESFGGSLSKKKNISVSIREMNAYEYDEDEVIYIECGLKPEKRALSYTSEIRKKEIEEADNPKPEVVANPEPEVAANPEPEVAANPEPEVAAKPEPLDWKKTQVVDMSEAEELGEDFADEGTFKEEEPKEKEEAGNTGKTLHLTWIDDVSGETKKLKIDHFPFAIGRKSDDNDYTIARKGISRKHMRFEEADGEVFVYDDQSTNGVRLNGDKITPETLVKLNSGDRIRVLDITFNVQID